MKLLHSQNEPAVPYRTWMVNGDRGSGKTFAGAHWVGRRLAPGRHIALVQLNPKLAAEMLLTELLRTPEAVGAEIKWVPGSGEIWVSDCRISLLGFDGIKRLPNKSLAYAWLDEPFVAAAPARTWDELYYAMAPHYQVCVTGKAVDTMLMRRIIAEHDTLRTGAPSRSALDRLIMPPPGQDEPAQRWGGI